MKKLLAVFIMFCTILGLPVIAQEIPEIVEEPAKEEAAFVFGSARSDILMADLVGFGLTFSTLGLHFLTGAILGSDGNYTITDQIISSSITELSSIPLFICQSPDALPLTFTGAFLLGAEYVAIKEYGLFSREQ